ncbi:unnamed protein product, partial [Tilletia controversa]
MEIERTILKNVPYTEEAYQILRNANTVTFSPTASQTSLPIVQIVLRCYHNVAEVLANFDLDQVAVGFTGDEVWLEPRALRAIKHGASVMTEKLSKMTTIPRIMKYARRGYGIVVRPELTEDVDTVVPSLCHQATSAYDSVSSMIKKARDPSDLWVPAHRTSEAVDFVGDVKARLCGSWLDSYSGFTMAAALWDHAYMGDLSAFVDNFSARAEVDDYEADPSDILDYNHAWPLDDQDDWTDAISFAYSFGQTVKTKELNFRVVNERSGLSLKDTLLRPLWIVLFLPQGFSKSSKVHLLEVAYAEVLYPVSDAPVIYDQDGMAFELYTWRLDQTNNWEPEEGILLHSYQLITFTSQIPYHFPLHTSEILNDIELAKTEFLDLAVGKFLGSSTVVSSAPLQPILDISNQVFPFIAAHKRHTGSGSDAASYRRRTDGSDTFHFRLSVTTACQSDPPDSVDPISKHIVGAIMASPTDGIPLAGLLSRLTRANDDKAVQASVKLHNFKGSADTADARHQWITVVKLVSKDVNLAFYPERSEDFNSDDQGLAPKFVKLNDPALPYWRSQREEDQTIHERLGRNKNGSASRKNPFALDLPNGDAIAAHGFARKPANYDEDYAQQHVKSIPILIEYQKMPAIPPDELDESPLRFAVHARELTGIPFRPHQPSWPPQLPP